MHPQITSDRLIAKALSIEELSVFIAAPAAFAAKMKINIPPGEPDEALIDAITNFLLPNAINAGEDYLFFTLWLIIEKETPNMAGSFCFHGKPENGKVEIGYGINALFQGRGYVTEVLKAVTDWARKRDDIQLLIAETDHGNIASIKALEKAAFEKTEIREKTFIYSTTTSTLD